MRNKRKYIRTTGIILLFCVALLNTACVSKQKEKVVLELKQGLLSLIPLNQNAVRVQFSQPGSAPMEELIYTEKLPVPEYEVTEDKQSLVLSLDGISVEFDKGTEVLTFKDANKRIILQEKVGGRFMKVSSVQNEPTYQVEQRFVSPKDEYIYGTGQFQDGYLNIRGLTRRLTQVNTQISIPFILSSKGYGLLWNNYGLTDFNPADQFVELTPANASGEAVTVNTTGTSGNVRETRQTYSFTASVDVPRSGSYSLLLDVGQRMARKYYLVIDGQKIVDVNNLWLPPTTSAIVELTAGKHDIEVQGERNDKPVLYWRPVSEETVFRSSVAQMLDYTVFAGNGDEVIASYRELTGPAPMMPLWSLGYIHCRERYNTQAELLENAREFRERKLPIDMIVQDWQYWGKYGWNAMKFDEDRYPDPGSMMKELHEMDVRLMISVWSKIDAQSEVGKQAKEKGYYIPGSDWIDFFNPDAAAFYWQNFRTGLLKYGIDAWWQDATEPENDDLQNRRINREQTPGEVYRNVYPMYVSKTIYEGLRQDDPDRRAMIFTRSGFSGMQRYAAATWSGDVGHDWETLRRQIVGGLGQMATGLPWWTYDAGGFFRPGDQYTNTGYHEQLIRWIQAGTFLPLMRVHGYMSNTEPWRYGEKVEYIIARYLDLRYRLLPYIYSQNAAVSFNGSTLMRPLVMDFPEDRFALEQNYQFMFGPSILVAPVVESGVNRMKVYLPECSAGWVDFWNGTPHKGGIFTDVNVDLMKTPLFVKAGSILPLGPQKQYASEETEQPWEIRIYPGADGSYSVYEDEGINYNYEKGQFSTFDLKWNDSDKTLTISDRKGSFVGMKERMDFNIVIVTPESGTGIYQSKVNKSIVYEGKSMVISL